MKDIKALRSKRNELLALKADLDRQNWGLMSKPYQTKAVQRQLTVLLLHTADRLSGTKNILEILKTRFLPTLGHLIQKKLWVSKHFKIIAWTTHNMRNFFKKAQ